MRKFIFGCVLMVSGIIGGTGWLIACTCLLTPGSLPSVTKLFSVIDYGQTDGCVVWAFYIMALVGAVIAVSNIGENKKD
ncbi:MAG: hypothetical protein Q4D16_10345 [Eubacteriales bacterium]|nr:hypothetical protein [Eubacteriales bacterium]